MAALIQHAHKEQGKADVAVLDCWNEHILGRLQSIAAYWAARVRELQAAQDLLVRSIEEDTP